MVHNGKDGRAGEDGATGEAGVAGRDCRTADNGDGSYWQVCGEDSVMLYKAFCRDIFYDPDSALCDSRDMRLYRTAKIGSRLWMAENLDVVQYLDTAKSGYKVKFGLCYGGMDENCRQFGRLYRREYLWNYPKLNLDSAVICPKGWHLPDSTEWNALFDFSRENANGNFATALLSEEAWDGSLSFPKTGVDEFGFGVLPSGRMTGESFAGLHFSSCFHSMESFVYIGLNTVSYAPPVDSVGCSIRCVLD